jgi:hypothetical protein
MTNQRMVLERTVTQGRMTSLQRLGVLRNTEEYVQELMLPSVEGL